MYHPCVMNTCPLELEPLDTSEEPSPLGGSSSHLPVFPGSTTLHNQGHHFPDSLCERCFLGNDRERTRYYGGGMGVRMSHPGAPELVMQPLGVRCFTAAAPILSFCLGDILTRPKRQATKQSTSLLLSNVGNRHPDAESKTLPTPDPYPGVDQG